MLTTSRRALRMIAGLLSLSALALTLVFAATAPHPPHDTTPTS